MKKRVFAFSLFIILFFLTSCTQNKMGARLNNNFVSKEANALCNEFLSLYGNFSENYSEDSYALFGFDCLGFDIKEEVAFYQLKTLSFEILPEKLKDVLLTEIANPNENLLRFGFFNGTISSLIDEICVFYEKLYLKYDAFSSLSSEEILKLSENKDYNSFCEKMNLLYKCVQSTNVPSISENWLLSWLTGMTENQIYQLTKKVIQEENLINEQTYSFFKDLVFCLNDNGIDVWFCVSESSAQARALIDLLGLHRFVSGLIARMNTFDESERYTNVFDENSNFAFYCNEDGTWTRFSNPTLAKPYTAGKVVSVMNCLFPKYHFAGPIAAFVSSTQDYNIATEFDSLKLVICFDDFAKKEVSGIDVLTEVALYQKEKSSSLLETNENEDTFYFSFKNLEKQKYLDEMKNENLLVQSAIDRFSTGFFRIYRGYHSVKCSLEKRETDFYNYVASLIENHNATVGFAAICENQFFEYNGFENFPLLSVYKIAVAKCVLEKLEKKALTLEEEIHIKKEDLDKNTYSPILKDFAEDEFDISIRKLIEYALIKSDNNACDILIDFAGGVKNVKKSVLKDLKNDEFAENFPDFDFKNQFDITETEESMHKDLSFCYNNFASPIFMCRYFEKCVNANNISKVKSDFFNQCLLDLETGKDRLYKGFPVNTKFAHKTGTGPRIPEGLKIAWNDVGVFYLPNGKECYICVFIKDSYETDEKDSLLMQKIASATYEYFKY